VTVPAYASNAVTFQSRASAAPLLDALAIIKGLGDNTRKPLPDKVPETIIERSWRPHVFKDGGIDRQYYELAAYFALGTGIAKGLRGSPRDFCERFCAVNRRPFHIGSGIFLVH
jgi:hypothetical protein